MDWVDGDRLGIYGASYGGFATLSCLSRLPDLWSAGVAVSGFADLVETVRQFTATWRYRARDWLGDPDEPDDLARLSECSPLTWIDRVRAPLLLVHGTNDSRVAIAESERVAERLRSTADVVELITLTGEGHNLSDQASRRTERDASVDWFVQHLGGRW